MFAKWYRSTMKLDGRTIWWEHVSIFMPLFTAIGMVAAHYSRIPVLFVVGVFAGWWVGLWSYGQDLIAQRDNHADIKEDMRVPKAAIIRWIVFLILLLWVTSRWVQGQY